MALLGGLSAAAFMRRHWQKRPLLVRAACPGALPAVDRSRLFALAARDDVESRLVVRTGGRWSVRPGPLARRALPTLATPAWTLLVQGVDLHEDAAHRLLRRFRFVADARLDDVMCSYASDGGGVGPHVDSYDVFLLQTAGRRRWRVGRATGARVRDHVPLKMLAGFEPSEEWLLEPGDMLYLPPHHAHEGVAIGSCTTASIGFRTPSWNELAHEFLFAMAEREWGDGRYADKGRKATRTPAAIDREFVDAVRDGLSRIRWSRDDVERFVGRYFSEPKAHVFFEAPRPLSLRQFIARARARGLALDIKTSMLYRGRTGFICGESFAITSATREAFARLANHRTLDAASVIELTSDNATIALLHAWRNHGWIHIAEGERNGRSR